MRTYLVLPLLFLSILCAKAQSDPLVVKDSLAQQKWIDSKYEIMSLDEKIGQLFMVMVASDQNKAKTDGVKTLIQKHKIGGVIFSTGGLSGKQNLQTNIKPLQKSLY